MQYTVQSNALPLTTRGKLFPVYAILLLIPHCLLYILISNLTDIKALYAVLITYTAFISYVFVIRLNAPIYLIYHLIFLIVSQNILTGIGISIFHYQTDGANLKLLMVYKEVFALLLITLLYMKNAKHFKLIKFEKTFPLFVVWLGISFAMSIGDMESRFYYLRGFGILFVSYFLGRLLFFSVKENEKRFQSVIKYTVLLGVLSVIVGFAFMIIDQKSYIWKDWFSLGYIMEAKGTAYTDYPDWRTPLGEHYIPRMFSFFFDAINASYFAMVAIVCSYFIKRKEMVFVRFFLWCGLILTFGKGAIGILALFLFWVIALYKIKFKPRFFITVFISSIVGAFFFLKNSGFKSSMIVHFDGLIVPLTNSTQFPIGHGVGSGGVYYAMKNNILAYHVSHMGAESFFGTMIYQLGYPGTLLYVIFLAGCIKYLLFLAYREPKIDFQYIALSGIVFALFVISLFQEATFGINYTGILIIFVGFSISSIQYKLKNEGNA